MLVLFGYLEQSNRLKMENQINRESTNSAVFLSITIGQLQVEELNNKAKERGYVYSGNVSETHVVS